MKIKLIPVLVAAVLYWVLGGLWYSPLLFANRFIALMRWTPQELEAIQKASEGKELAIAFVSSALLAYVLAHFVRYTNASSVADGLKTGFWLWLGFVITTNLETVLFENRPLGLYLINNGYHLVGFLMMGAILAVWGNQPVKEVAYQKPTAAH